MEDNRAMTQKKPNVKKTLNERLHTHGDFSNHARVAQSLKNVLRKEPLYKGLSDVQVEALEMILHKIARVVSGNPDHKDHWHDIAGYAVLVEEQLK